MTDSITQSQAREILASVKSPAADSIAYTAQRLTGGWIFGWNEDQGHARLGTHSWVVADNSQVLKLSRTQKAEDALSQLNSQQ